MFFTPKAGLLTQDLSNWKIGRKGSNKSLKEIIESYDTQEDKGCQQEEIHEKKIQVASVQVIETEEQKTDQTLAAVKIFEENDWRKFLSCIKLIKYKELVACLNSDQPENNEKDAIQDDLCPEATFKINEFIHAVDIAIESGCTGMYRKVRNKEKPYELHSDDAEKALRNILDCLQAVYLKLTLIYEETILFEKDQSFRRIICREDSLSKVLEVLKCHLELTVNAFVVLHDEQSADPSDHEINFYGLMQRATYSLCLSLQIYCTLITDTSIVGEEVGFKLIYMCLDVCCTASTQTGNQIGCKELKNLCADLLTCIFAVFKDQRAFIVEDIISNMVQTYQRTSMYKLVDGKSIHYHSALLFQLVLGCCSENLFGGWHPSCRQISLA